MITKKQFVEIFEIIIQQEQKDRNTCKILVDTLNLDTPALEGNLIMMYSRELIHIMLKMLSYYFKDEALTAIKHYYYIGGREHNECYFKENGKKYFLKTAEDLYDYLVECYSDVSK